MEESVLPRPPHTLPGMYKIKTRPPYLSPSKCVQTHQGGKDHLLLPSFLYYSQAELSRAPVTRVHLIIILHQLR